MSYNPGALHLRKASPWGGNPSQPRGLEHASSGQALWEVYRVALVIIYEISSLLAWKSN